MNTRATIALAAAVAVLTALGVILLWTLRAAPPSTTPTPALSPTASPTPSYNPDAGDAAEDEGPGPAETQDATWGPIVDRFARNFTNTTGGAQHWRQRLIGNRASPDVTTEVSQQLKTVALSNVPAGHYTGRQLVKSSAYEVAVKVTYREGWAMILYLITDGTRYQIYAYDRWEA